MGKAQIWQDWPAEARRGTPLSRPSMPLISISFEVVDARAKRQHDDSIQSDRAPNRPAKAAAASKSPGRNPGLRHTHGAAVAAAG